MDPAPAPTDEQKHQADHGRRDQEQGYGCQGNRHLFLIRQPTGCGGSEVQQQQHDAGTKKAAIDTLTALLRLLLALLVVGEDLLHLRNRVHPACLLKVFSGTLHERSPAAPEAAPILRFDQAFIELSDRVKSPLISSYRSRLIAATAVECGQDGIQG